MKYAYRDVRRYGSMRGIIVRGTVKIWDTSLAGIAMLWAKAQGAAVFRAYTGIIYERFWKRELDMEDIAVVEGVLEEAGASTVGFREYVSGEGRALHDTIQHATFEAGIFGVPTYIIDRRKVFRARASSARPMDAHWPSWHAAGYLRMRDISAERAREKLTLPFAIDFKSPYAYLATAPDLCARR